MFAPNGALKSLIEFHTHFDYSIPSKLNPGTEMDRITEHLETELELASDALKAKELELNQVLKTINEAGVRKMLIEHEIIRLEASVSRARELVFLHKHMGAQHERRTKILELKAEAKRTDITIDRKYELDRNIADALTSIQAGCSHPFVVSYDGHAGFQCQDYEDSYPGIRMCVVCGHQETSASHSEEKYSCLFKNNKRMIKRDLKHRPPRWGADNKLDIWQPLEVLIPAFERSAGCMNLRWE